MTLRRILVSLGILAALAGAALLLLPSAMKPVKSVEAKPREDFPARSFEFSYESQSYLNPTLPSAAGKGQGLTIACESRGLMHLGRPRAMTLHFLFEFTSVLCGGVNVMSERGLARTVHYSREFLASEDAMQRATEDPALAIARSLFLPMDLGQKSRWSDDRSFDELRIEGRITPELAWVMDKGQVQWTKKFSGPVPGDEGARGLSQSLQYQVGARSEVSEPMEWGLLQLDGHEQSVSLQNQNLVARTDITVRLVRTSVSDARALRDLWADTEINRPAAAPRIMSSADKDRILQRWRHFRDREGQNPARGANEESQDEYLELKKALRDEPSLADELVDDFNDMDPASSAFATLSGALIYSGEAAALNAFVRKALEHKNEMEWQSRALPMIGLAPVPTAQSWTYLETMRKQANEANLKSAAELGMGTHLKHGFQDGNFVAEIQIRMENARTQDERLHLLDVVGNAGLDQFFPLIRSWLPSASPVLRIRIVQALRFMLRPDAEMLLMQLAADAEPELALGALQSLRERQVSNASIPLLLHILSSRSDDRIRLQALENLYEARHLDADLLPKIQRIRSGLSLSAALAAAWNQIEKDWVDPVET
ncbi:MAG TPA: HEAT repeat domain-containing protein [Oligoflexus sp.]|uniref:HEAT repeat domain-containing protein n=1 Tax=Oligoflexus sp. TaxID=1971216 RepID=UPI002D8046AC|nr:HEAT repeat domain-containing protein [Oligoflexus sp.]HET9240919.1 HEAT repeat domain-containing protein [Oligoflexus sp.]